MTIDFTLTAPPPPRRQCLDYRCMYSISSLGNSSTAAGSSDHGGTVGPTYSYAVGSFFSYQLYTSFHISSSLLTFFLSLFILLYSCCSHAQIFGKTLVYELHISNNLTEWSFFSRGEIVLKLLWSKLRSSKLNCNNNSPTSFSFHIFSSFSSSKSSKTQLMARAYPHDRKQGITYLTLWPMNAFVH